jgi:hypothetical protein
VGWAQFKRGLAMRLKLWLDDERKPPDGTWRWAKTVDDAKLCIIWATEFGTFTEASLDHDLGQGYDKDGLALVDWMVEYHFWPITKPRVHSMNPVGRQRMQMTIDRYYPE